MFERFSPVSRSSLVSSFVVVSLFSNQSSRVSCSHRGLHERREFTESNWIQWQRKLSFIRLSAHTAPQKLPKQANRFLRALLQKREEGRDYSSKIQQQQE